MKQPHSKPKQDKRTISRAQAKRDIARFLRGVRLELAREVFDRKEVVNLRARVAALSREVRRLKRAEAARLAILNETEDEWWTRTWREWGV